LKITLRLLCISLLLSLSAFATVTVTAPKTGTTVTSPVQFVASATSTHAITGMRIYIDNVSVFATTASSINTNLSVGTGTHAVVIKAWDSTGVISSQSLSISVSGTAPTPTPTPTPTATPTPSPSPAPTASPTPTPSGGLPAPPAGAVVKTDIDQMTGWQDCTTCAGANGAGPAAVYSMQEGIASPSLDGSAAQFNISGTTPYSDALWWKQLGGNNNIHNFKYDVSFYLKDSAAPQALEFDVNQSNNVHKFIFGTECDIKNMGVWKIWTNAASNSWTSTGVPCSAPAAFMWHHLTWEFQRDDTQLTFIGFTFDGVTHYINRSFPAMNSSVSEINVAFQMDGNSKMAAYSTWLDNVTLTYW
jgi:hypothetical protein